LGIRRAKARSLSVTSRQEIWDNFINNWLEVNCRQHTNTLYTT
jgi:hypothetical protein